MTDDHADGPSAATFLAVGGSMNGEIDRDRDRDYFYFDVIPYAEYTIDVTPIGAASVDEAEVALYEADGHTRIMKRSSVNQGSAQLLYLARSVARRVYIDVRSFAEYSSGSYQVSLAMTGTPTDSDNDGLPDVWEMDYNLSSSSDVGINGPLGDPDNDGMNNEQELASGTDPRNGNSRLILSNSVALPGSTEITWEAIPFATYRITRSSSLVSPIWMPIATVMHNVNSSLASYTDPGTINADTMFYYRVEMAP